ncbi:hypothetical protein [[Flexibacter] sp. ATCC 35208]|uniref:hypothetical protein n=1 Tax=[Flexibacter] sp. ATCC 35208 TaxID=1936242 RepID=UPI0009D045B7|nr:hypothetical protein [[Flexibacter] sp. ATCC 35208]OMP80192.1 hypothetical protein BW716_05135 [[Flexibacter] sp. ATCC 35208]
MKTSYKRLLQIISILLLLFLPWMRTWSCGPDYFSDDYRFVLFQPELSRAPGLSDLRYNIHMSVLKDSDPQKKDYQRNCREWQQQVGGTIPDIYNIQYGMEPDEFLYAYRHAKWDHIKDNSFLHALLQPANKPMLDYMAFAKQVEFNQFGEYDPWQTGNDNGGQEQTKVLLRLGKLAFAKTTNPFLKERYAFQLVKLNYYGGGNWDSLPGLYDTYLKGHKTIVADWGLLYYALCKQDKVTSTKLLCETFERSEEKKTYIYNTLASKDLDTLLQQYPKIPVAWFIKGLKQPGRGLSIIQSLHRVAPQYQYLPMLVVREVNKLEDWIMSPTVLGFNSSVKLNEYDVKRFYNSDMPDTTYDYYAKKNLLKDQAYMRTVRSYLESILSKSDSNHVVYALAIAHLYNMDGEYAKAIDYLNDIHPRKNSFYRRQWITEQLIAIMHAADISSNAVKADLSKQVKELMALGATFPDPNNYDENAEDRSLPLLLLMMSQQYQKQQDAITAGHLFEKANILVNGYYGSNYEDDTTQISYHKIAYFDQYGTPADIDRLIQFKHAKHKTAFEKFISPGVWSPDDFYKDVKLSLLVRQQRFKEALGVAEEMDAYFWRDNYAYSGYLPDKYIGSADFLVPGETLKNDAYPFADKRGILRDIVALSDSLKQFPQNAALYYKMGNVLYNLSYGGRGWMLANYGKGEHTGYYYNIGWDEYEHSALNRRYQAAYYRCEAAMNMYRKALVYGGSQKELCAKVLLMMSVCDKDRNAYVIKRQNWSGTIYKYEREGPYHSTYLDVLKKKYGGTEVYAEAVTNCPDVK